MRRNWRMSSPRSARRPCMMPTEGLMPVPVVAGLIRDGHFLCLAGDEAALRQLPPGNWIGGTIPFIRA